VTYRSVVLPLKTAARLPSQNPNPTSKELNADKYLTTATDPFLPLTLFAALQAPFFEGPQNEGSRVNLVNEQVRLLWMRNVGFHLPGSPGEHEVVRTLTERRCEMTAMEIHVHAFRRRAGRSPGAIHPLNGDKDPVRAARALGSLPDPSSVPLEIPQNGT